MNKDEPHAAGLLLGTVPGSLTLYVFECLALPQDPRILPNDAWLFEIIK
jgi:hypothetical protein